MKRDMALEVLKKHVTDEIVVAVYQTLFDWMPVFFVGGIFNLYVACMMQALA